MNQLMQEKYGYTREVAMDFESAVERVTETLKGEGFGVLSEIRMDEKLKEKLGVDFRKYVILGACNPTLAYKTIQEEINIGMLLPCNVIVYEGEQKGTSVIGAIDAKAMMSVVGDSPALAEVAIEANDRLQRALGSV